MSSVAEKLQSKAKKPVGTKQVRLKLVYIDFWSTVKLSFLIAVALGIVIVVATFLIYVILSPTGVFDTVDTLLQEILGDNELHAPRHALARPGHALRDRRRGPQHRRRHRARRHRRAALQPERAHHRRPAGRLHQQLTVRSI